MYSTPEHDFDHDHHHRHHHRGHHRHHHHPGMTDPTVEMGRGGFLPPDFPFHEVGGDSIGGERRDFHCDPRQAFRGMPGFLPFGGPGQRGNFGRAKRGKLRESVLKLLAEQPRNGYQLMGELAERTLGVWAPSPGAIYPCLNQLTDEGLIEAIDLDGQKVYQLTEAGRQAADQIVGEPWSNASLRDARDRLWRNAEQWQRLMDEFHQLGGTLQTAVRSASQDQLTAIAEEVAALKRRIFAILASDPKDED